MAEPRQRFARRAIAQFGLVAQGEQRLLAAGLGAGLGDRQHLLLVEIGRLAVPRRMRKGAVMADVAAQLRQRDEDLLRIGHEIAVAAVAQCGGDRHQRAEIAAIGEGEAFVEGKARAGFGAGEDGRDLHKTIPPAAGAASLRTGIGPAGGGITQRRCCCRLFSHPPNGGGEGRHVICEPQARPCARSELRKMPEIGRVVDIQRDSRQMQYG